MPFVIDASVTLAWYFEDEEHSYAHRVLGLLDGQGAVVPGIWCLEVANGLAVAERRGRLSTADVSRVVSLLLGLPITVEDTTASRALGPVLELAREQGLSAYDAGYLELAMREGLPLITQDADLREASARAGVPLVE